MFPDDLTTAVLTKALQGYNARNEAIANNVANADTPGYKRVDVDFESQLIDAIQADRSRLDDGAGGGTEAMTEDGWSGGGADMTSSLSFGDGNSSATDSVAPTVLGTDTTTMRVDGSNVDPDDEMARLSANQLADQTVVSLLDKRFGQFRTAITGR